MAEKSPAAVLHELAIKEGTLPEYEFVAQTGPQHISLFELHCTMLGLKATGKARSKKEAKQECAQVLLLKMARMGYKVPAPFNLPKAPVPIANSYGDTKDTGLEGKSIMARGAAEDGARGEKRKGYDYVNDIPQKINTFVKYSQDNSLPTDNMKASCSTLATSSKTALATAGCSKDVAENIATAPKNINEIDYLEELSSVNCVSTNYIAEHMFNTKFGKLVLLVRFWQTKLQNIQSSCQLCGLDFEFAQNTTTDYCTIKIEKKLVAQAQGDATISGRATVENEAFQVLINEAISIFVKERFMPQDGAPISFTEAQESNQPEPRQAELGAPVEASVASRMMKMMGWQGGGLGVNAQGIAEPVKPHFQIIHRAGLGSVSADIRQFEASAVSVMKRYVESDNIDDDLVFNSEFNMDERKAIHIAAKRVNLKSRSYGRNEERFIVVQKWTDPFHLAHAVVRNGGSTAKYIIFIPAERHI